MAKLTDEEIKKISLLAANQGAATGAHPLSIVDSALRLTADDTEEAYIRCKDYLKQIQATTNF